MNNTEKIEKWITDQRSAGVQDSKLYGTIFYSDKDVYVINKSRKKGKFDITCTIGGGVDLNNIANKI